MDDHLREGGTQEDEEKKELGGRLDAFILYVHSTSNLCLPIFKWEKSAILFLVALKLVLVVGGVNMSAELHLIC